MIPIKQKNPEYPVDITIVNHGKVFCDSDYLTFYCGDCGKQVWSGARKCTECGAILQRKGGKMKRVALEGDAVVREETIKDSTPIFAKRNGKLSGSVIKDARGWSLSLGGGVRATGYHNTRKKCIEAGIEYGHTFYVEEDVG